MVAALYLGLAYSLSDQPVTRRVREGLLLPGGDVLVTEQEQVDLSLFIEKEANKRALESAGSPTSLGRSRPPI
jgi:hypothetical protein